MRHAGRCLMLGSMAVLAGIASAASVLTTVTNGSVTAPSGGSGAYSFTDVSNNPISPGSVVSEALVKTTADSPGPVQVTTSADYQATVNAGDLWGRAAVGGYLQLSPNTPPNNITTASLQVGASAGTLVVETFTPGPPLQYSPAKINTAIDAQVSAVALGTRAAGIDFPTSSLGLIDLHVDTPPIPSVILASVALVSSLNSSDPLVPWPVHVKLTSGSTHRDLIDNLSPSPFRDDVVTTVQFKVDGATVPNAVGGNNLLASHTFNAGDSGTTDLSGADLEYDFVPASYIPPAATSASLEAGSARLPSGRA